MVKEIHDLQQLEKNGISVDEMYDSCQGSDGETMKCNIDDYIPNMDIVNKLAKKANGYTIVVFSADWCKDCKINVAAFAKIVQLNSDIKAIFFKGMKSAPKDPNIRWRIPPSPPEVDDFDLRRIPSFYVLDKSGKVVGELIENPVTKPTVEEELLFILENIQG
ncbi:MAG: hypothetical protein FK733_16980 [Asgard group archaeon]|nr:hypothetical protein [Asgard group archaeon]